MGAFGKVKLATHVGTGMKVAVKVLNKEKIRRMNMNEKTRREVRIK